MPEVSIKAFLTTSEMMIDSDCQWLWQTGKYYYEDIIRTGIRIDQATIFQFMHLSTEWIYAFAAADIIVSRAGAGTISELCLVGKPVILVPSPNVAEDHQTRNAQALI